MTKPAWEERWDAIETSVHISWTPGSGPGGDAEFISHVGERPREHDIARARLAAAAPELYRALEACEYSDNSDGEYSSRCPVCRASGPRTCVDPGQALNLPPEAYEHPAKPHEVDCIVAAALRKARGE